jgi:hypothetical protein
VSPRLRAQPTGVVDELLNAARDADGGLDEQQIAETFNTSELGVDVEVRRQRSTTPTGENDD